MMLPKHRPSGQRKCKMRIFSLCLSALALSAVVASPLKAQTGAILVGNVGGGSQSARVGLYDSSSGAVINANFVTGTFPNALALDANNHIFVANSSTGT